MCRSCKMKERKIRDQKRKLVEESKNNMQQPSLETLVLRLHCYRGEHVKHGLISKHLCRRKE